MMRKLIGILLCLVFVAGCGPKSDSVHSQPPDIQAILNQAGVIPQYINTGSFSGEELKIVTALNALMKCTLSDDVPGIIKLYVEGYLNEHDVPQDDHVLSLIVSMESPRFNFTSHTNAEVFIKQSDMTLADPDKNVITTEKIYYMVQENEAWKIASIQN